MKTKVRKNFGVVVCIMMFAAVFVVAATMNVCAQPPTEVWVDDDWVGSNLGDPVNGHTFGVDAFATIQDGIDAVAENGTVNVYEGFYYENVIVAKPVSLTGDITLNGNLTVDDNGNLTFDNVILKMNVTYDGQYHIEVKDGGAMYIQNGCVITDGDGDDDEQPPDSPDNHRFLFWVREGAKFEMCDSELYECGYDYASSAAGLWVATDNALIHHNQITNCFYGIFLEANYGTISGNTVYNCHRGMFLPSDHSTVTNNTVTYNDNQGIVTIFGSHCTINDNIASDNGREGILIFYGSSNVMMYNDGHFNNLYGISLYCSNTNTVKYNNVSQNKVNGILLGSPDPDGPKTFDNIIEANIATDCETGIACGSGGAEVNMITDNFATDNTYGIRVFGQSNENTIKNNTISNNDYGILAVTASNNTVKHNTISNNGVGFYIAYEWEYPELASGISKNNAVMNNTITSNYLGIYLDNASINTEIMYNNITENIVSGILCNGSFGTKTKYNNICNNYGYGIKNIDSIIDPFTLVNATYNWWGDPSGPSGVAQGSGDAVSEWVDYEYWLTAPVSTERASKEIAIAELEAAKTGDEKIDRSLDHILKDLQKSLNKDPMSPDEPWKEYPLWLGYSHLDPQHGHMVFDCEKEAVKKILELLKHEDLPDSVKEACYEVIAKLMEADDDIVKILLEEAKAYAGTSKQVDHQIMLAEQELAKAEEALAKGEYDKAIGHYKKAWEHAQLAIYLANK